MTAKKKKKSWISQHDISIEILSDGSSVFKGCEKLSMMGLRVEPGEILNRVYYSKKKYVITCAGKPKALLLPIEEL